MKDGRNKYGVKMTVGVLAILLAIVIALLNPESDMGVIFTWILS